MKVKNRNPKKHAFRNTPVWVKKIKVAALSAAVSSYVCLGSVTSLASDIEIYGVPANNVNSAAVIMMLDTSGSMDQSSAGVSACDFSENYTYSELRISADIAHATFGARPYSRAGCTVTGRKVYRYIQSVDYVNGYPINTNWRRCDSIDFNRGSFSKNNCTVAINSPTSFALSGLAIEEKDRDVITNNTFTRDSTYYSSNTTSFSDLGSTQLDRISRLKDALYAIAISPVDDPETTALEGIKSNVRIGIGTFPYFGSGSDNNKRAIIRVPAGTWGPVGSPQRTAVINMLKDPTFIGKGGTPTSAAYAEAAAYLLGTTTGGGAYSGQNLVTNSAIGTSSKYQSPITPNSAPECSGQGIYFLTDGQPQTPVDSNTSTLMANALGLTSYSFSSSLSNNGLYDDVGAFKSDWQAIGSFAHSLNDEEIIRRALGQQKGGRKIATSVVGFGSVFAQAATNPNDITDPDAKNAYLWGQISKSYGQGGVLAATQSSEIVNDLNSFIGDVSGKLPSVSTGSSTIPVDVLNPEAIQPFSYFSQFEPKVSTNDSQQMWLGNLKKYHVVNNGIYASSTGGSSNQVVKDNNVQDVVDMWSKSGMTYSANTPIYQKGGALSRMLIGLKESKENQLVAARKILTDYVFDGTKAEAERIGRDLDLIQIDQNYTKNAKTKSDNAQRTRGLLALLGYDIPENTATENLDLSTYTASVKQMGSVMHSLPLLLTQEGKAVVAKNGNKVTVDTTDREDYVLFGTTQGLLHVVEAETGKEKFVFLPKEMAEKQYETFKKASSILNGGKNALYYGVDGEWTAHTVYTSTDDGTLTVSKTNRASVDSSGDNTIKEDLEGKQWVYGGMRMGGRSYYALDLTDIDHPKVKFHIDPSTSKVYSQDHPTGKSFAPITNMGQSWSKPKLDYINWNGQRKLVMIVGGGYDAGGSYGDGLYSQNGIRTGYEGYEKHNYIQTNKRGAGVYMFDADNGDLLWYADSNSETTLSNTTTTPESSLGTSDVKHSTNSDLKYSVATEIKTVDRDNNGVIDHIYFGDLSGQAFRVDLKNDGTTTSHNFTTRVTKILDLHKADGTSPRFYLPPVFTAHQSSSKKEGGDIVIATFISGNKSSPMLATSSSPSATGQTNSTGLEYDGVYAVYEYDIYPKGQFYPATVSVAKSLAADDTTSISKLKKLTTLVNSGDTSIGARINSSNGWGGWYYQFDKNYNGQTSTQGVVKGLTPLIAMEGNLYVTMFDAAEAGTSSSCGAGVKGQSFTKRICLPSGVCPEDAEYTYNLGAGIVSLNVGPNSDGTKSLVVQDPDKVCKGPNCSPCVGKDCKAGQKFIPAGGSLKFIPNRWYERYAPVGGS